MVPSEWLMRNAALQVAFSVLLGWVMLLPRQQRKPGRLAPLLSRDFTAAHLDWLMLAFMQLGAALIATSHALPAPKLAVACLVFGGWVNPVPYVLRAFGVNAFALRGSAAQLASAALSGLSSLAITVGWALVLLGVFGVASLG